MTFCDHSMGISRCSTGGLHSDFAEGLDIGGRTVQALPNETQVHWADETSKN